MNAYIKFNPYKPDFYTDAFAHGVIKGDGTKSFASVLRQHGGKLQGRKLNKTLEDQKAIYLYGGRKALIREFRDFKRDVADFVLTPASGNYLAVFHDRITVSGNKTKRILMILSFSKAGWPPAAQDNRRLKVILGNDYQPRETRNYGFYTKLDFAGLENIVRELPD